MKFEMIDFYYFSGTGNTYLTVKKMQQVFEQQGIEVNLRRIEKTPPPLTIAPQHAVGLAFPVAEQGTYPFIWDFIRALPRSAGTPVFMVDTMMAFSGGIVGPVRKILKQKGYMPVGAKEITMPNNLFPVKINKEKNRTKLEKGLTKAEKYAVSLLEGRSSWGRIPLLSDLMSLFSQKEWTWKFLRKGYILKIDHDLCTRCGQCAKLCPVENIIMEGYPVYQERCFFCMRCVAFCPSKAIYSVKAHFVSHKRGSEYYKAVRSSDLTKDSG